MGPKINKKSEKCPFYNRGYCRNGENCDQEHPDKVCPASNCFDDKCQHRHPNLCKFSYIGANSTWKRYVYFLI